jgi:hypothetical protein
VYPNFKEISKYKGILRAGNFEIFHESLKKHQMLDQAEDFLLASGKLQSILYKEEIEASLRTSDFGGFQLLDLHDFPGQGTALVGILDAFWEKKGYIQAEEFHQFCCETVPLVRLEKCVWTTNEIFQARVEIAHFGRFPINGCPMAWTLEYLNGKQVTSGTLNEKEIPIGNGTSLGTIKIKLDQIKAPAQLKLNLYLKDTPYQNHWYIWVYTPESDDSVPDSIQLTESLNPDILSALKSGQSVLYLPPPEVIDNNIPTGFTTIFWNTQWTKRQPPHTLGVLCNPKHPIFNLFPTEFHSNWQWWDLVTKSKFMILDSFPADLRPLVQIIDDWNTNRKLGLIFEAVIGNGKLLVCSIDLKTNLNQRPVARQLLRSIVSYMDSDYFQPNQNVEINLLTDFMKSQHKAKNCN